MHKVGEVANKIVVSNSNYKLVQIKKNEQFIYNKFKSLNIMNENMLNKYKASPNFKELLNTDNRIFKHPIFAQKIEETEKSIVYKIVTISHSPKPIKINDKKVDKEIISYYIENGRQVAQYATKASWLLEVDKNDPNIIIEEASKSEIERVGGQENMSKIASKLEKGWDKKETYEYIDYLKNSVIHDISKYEIEDLKNQNKKKLEEE
jgi:hypothetical protein